MSTTCKIATDILYNCDFPPVTGSRDRVIVLPRRLVKGYTLNTTNPLIIEDIDRILNATETEFEGKAVQYVGNGRILSPQLELVEDDFGGGYMHQLEFHVFGTTPEVKYELHKLKNEIAGHVLILQQNYKDTTGKSEYLVLGRDVGCYVKEMQDEEGRNIMRLLIGNRDDKNEPLPTSNLFITDKDTTDELVEGLLSVVIPSP